MTTLIDLETNVVNRYSGEARMQRLLWIATRTTTDSDHGETTLRHLAYRAATHLAVQQQNATRYKDIFHQYNEKVLLKSQQLRRPEDEAAEISGPREITGGLLDVFDAQWYNDTSANNRQNRDILQSRLQASQAHLNKEAIRVAYLALAEFATRTGDISEAFHSALRAKDYCTTRQQTTTVTLQILMYSILLRNYHVVREYVPRLEHTLVAASSASSPGPANAGSSAMDQTMSSTVRICVLIASGLDKIAAAEMHHHPVAIHRNLLLEEVTFRHPLNRPI
jgi:26S proteasome subunit RPN7